MKFRMGHSRKSQWTLCHLKVVTIKLLSTITHKVSRVSATREQEGVITHVNSISERHGIPEEIVADNQPFCSYVFRQSAKSWGIKVTTSRATHAQSNGQAERAVQTLKWFLKKADAEGRDPYITMLEYRNTPISGLRYAPAQLAVIVRQVGSIF